MSQIPKHQKVKRSQKRVLVKRKHFLTNFPEIKSYKPLCKKLQSNNNSLAKALSKEKQESQLLFSQNVALISEVQDLGLACNKRDAVISNILKNAKEMLKMLVTMTGYLTNTISCCQEFTESLASNMQMSCNNIGRRESLRRLSIKSPTRGVVKPMVSGHTITKPTINLSRINMPHLNNSSNLSIIPEVTTPPRNQELNSLSSFDTVSVRPRRYENGRTCRMPERLTVVSPRVSDESERRLSGRSSKHSERITERHSKSKTRLSRNNSSRFSIENLEYIGSPRVKLNDVSKLLQNSQSINIRMLTENQSNQETNSSENSDGAIQENSLTDMILETPPDESKDDDNKDVKNKNKQNNGELDTTNQQDINWEDPLEGPSWLFNNLQAVPSFSSKDKKTDDIDVSDDDSMNITLKITESDDVSDNEKTVHQMSSPSMSSKHLSDAISFKNNKQISDENECSMLQQNENSDTFCNTIESTDKSEDECKTKNVPMDVVSFVTQRRGCFEKDDDDDDDDDFTLMYTQKPRNMHFDINDLKLPVLEQSALKPISQDETEPEITSTLPKISQICPIPSVSHNTLNESQFNQSTVELPLLMNNNYHDEELTPLGNQLEPLQRKRKMKNVTKRRSIDFIDSTPPEKKNCQRKRKNKPVKDPSAVKVVLEKLSESEVKSRTPSPNETTNLNSSQSLSIVSLPVDHSSDSESNGSSNSLYTLSRPRRNRAQITFHEPSLKRKLRRN